VFDPVSVIGSHLAEAARSHAGVLLGRQELQTLLEHLRASVPTVVKEIGTDALPLSAVQKAFALLLRERVWPRDPIAVLEAMIDAAPGGRDPRDLAEAARRVIVPVMLRRKAVEVLEPMLLDPQLERSLGASFAAAGGGAIDPALALRIRDRAQAYARSTPQNRAALICTTGVRPLLADFLLRSGVRLAVYSYAEVPAETRLTPVTLLKEDALADEGPAAA
ncbi:MAG TPA: FHIPEP family type III secretion protein, partial [Candidatus Baltobacteraceae bacterium]|nr:FHIPEP family type III secretion protein [Candidatus Baltobacteraceae bacterium]